MSSQTPSLTITLFSFNKLPMGAIVGIVIGLFLLITLSVTITLIYLRQRRRRRSAAYADFTSTPYPFANGIVSSNGEPRDRSDTGSISTARQQYLRNELHAAHEKIVDVEALGRRTSTAQGLGRTSTRTSDSDSGSGSPNPDSDLVSRLRNRNEMLQVHIRELEAQLESPWALGLSGEPLPGYSED